MLYLASSLVLVTFTAPAVFEHQLPPAATISAIGQHLSVVAASVPRLCEGSKPIGISRCSPDPAWLESRPRRPTALPPLYLSLGALQALDTYTTYRVLQTGGTELNPVVRNVTGNFAAILGVKAAATAGTVYFAERAWKKHRRGAVILMVAINAVTAAAAANNMKNVR